MEHSAGAAAAVSFIGIEPLTVLALLALGFLGGMLSGFIGSGGAFVLTPGMMNLGVLGPVAVASNMCHKFPKALVGAWKRRKLGHVDFKLGAVIGVSAIGGVMVGVRIQEAIIRAWGSAGSNLYISLTFVLILFTVGFSMLRDSQKSMRSGSSEEGTPKFAQRVAKLNIPPMMYFRQANARVTLWVTVPAGFATGILAATIAVGGFIGVPSMIYIIGAPPFVASGTELIVAFFMGMEGTIEWAVRGYVDLRLVVLIFAGSLIGVQVGAAGTAYVKQYMIKFVSAAIMLLAGLSRVMVIPVYLSDAGVISLAKGTHDVLGLLSSVILYGTLVVAAGIITVAMIKGRRESVREALIPKPEGIHLDAARVADTPES